MARATEYAFKRPDGSEAYHFVDPDAGFPVGEQIRLMMKAEGAVAAIPVDMTRKEDEPC